MSDAPAPSPDPTPATPEAVPRGPLPPIVVRLFLVVFTAVILLTLWLLYSLLSPIVLGLVLYALFDPVYQWVVTRVPRKEIAAGLTTTGVVIAVVVPIGLFISALSSQAAEFYRATQESDFLNEVAQLASGEGRLATEARALAARVGVDLTPQKIQELLADGAQQLAAFASGFASSMAGNVLSLVVDFGLIVILMASLFLWGPKLKQYLFDLSPLPDEQEARLVDRFSEMAKAVFVGNGVASILQGVFGGLGFWMFGIGGSALWGTAIAFFAFLPIVGASVIVAPATILLVLQGKFGVALGFALYNLVYIAVFEYWLKTKLSAGSVNAVLIFLGIVAGLSLFGMLGLFYGPLILAMFLTLAEIYKEDYREALLEGLASEGSDQQSASAAAEADPAAT
jgi:predicted PurR-regulated permease PerM